MGLALGAGDRPRDASRMQNAQPAGRRTPSPWPQGTRHLCAVLICPSPLRLDMDLGRIPHTLALAPDLIPARTRSGDCPQRGKDLVLRKEPRRILAHAWYRCPATGRPPLGPIAGDPNACLGPPGSSPVNENI